MKYMKQMILGLFDTHTDAENAINRLHNELNIATDDISYIHRNADGTLEETDAGDVSTHTTAEGAKSGATIGGIIGAIAGLATVAGLIPVIGPVVVAGPLMAALGLGAGALGTTAAGAVTGAAAGGIIGALTHWGVGEPKAQMYEQNLAAGKIMVGVSSEDPDAVVSLLSGAHATDVDVFTPSV